MDSYVSAGVLAGMFNFVMSSASLKVAGLFKTQVLLNIAPLSLKHGSSCICCRLERKTRNDSVLPTNCIHVFRWFCESTAAISICGINVLAQ